MAEPLVFQVGKRPPAFSTAAAVVKVWPSVWPRSSGAGSFC
ncbi:MAG: hypothetical protein M5U12_37145 [Verrucomicrobia bacterium]|nr:hypothetical protein [Verrucomicrobiota bacterium]